MELLSREFRRTIEALLTKKEVLVLVTVPTKSEDALVVKLKETSRQSKGLYNVTKSNRNQLPDEVFSVISRLFS